jgi:hypothetical protein
MIVSIDFDSTLLCSELSRWGCKGEHCRRWEYTVVRGNGINPFE